MIALRALAPVVLLLASLSAQAASGAVLLHVVTDHAVTSHHDDSHGDHDDKNGDDHHGADHGADHSHQFAPAPLTATSARAIGAEFIPQPFVPASHVISRLPDERAALLLAPPAQRAGPPESRRHAILLL